VTSHPRGKLMTVDSDWIWDALASGHESLLADSYVDYFDWNGSHDVYGTPLIAVILGAGDHGDSLVCALSKRAQERLDLMKFVLEKGGNPHRKPPAPFNDLSSFSLTYSNGDTVEGSRTQKIDFSGLSAYGVVLACLRAIDQAEGDWTISLENLRAAAQILASYRPFTGGVPRVPAALGVVEMWERILNAQESADFTIVCRGKGGSDSSAGTVVAHQVVLKAASRVLRAMLSGPFKEGAAEQVEVDCDAEPVRLLLSQMYTGKEVDTADVPLDVILSSLELAHQWDVGAAVASLEAAAAKAIEDASFGRAAEIAYRLHLQQLVDACAAFAKASEHVKSQFQASKYSGDVQAQLARVFGTLPQTARPSPARPGTIGTGSS